MMRTSMAVTITSMVLMVAVGAVLASDQCPVNTWATRLLTYNAALAPAVYGYEDRKSDVIAAIVMQSQQADYVCLQEMWFEEDMKVLLDAVEGNFPYHYSAIHSSVGNLRDSSRKKRFFGDIADWLFPGRHTVPCSITSLGKLTACLAWNCLTAEASAVCMIENCRESLYGLTQACRSCVALASSSTTDMWAKCTNKAKRHNRVNEPGLLVLSKRPLSNVQYVNYLPGQKVLLERGYIKAEVGGSLTHVCTHLTSYSPYYFEVGLPQFQNYEQQQRAEIFSLNATFTKVPHILMGDFNTGPERNETGFPQLTGEVPASYDLLTKDMGYLNSYLQYDGRCTFCGNENPVLIARNTAYEDLAVDFIMTKGLTSGLPTSAQRVLDIGGILLSDHYGVQVDMCQP